MKTVQVIPQALLCSPHASASLWRHCLCSLLVASLCLGAASAARAQAPGAPDPSFVPGSDPTNPSFPEGGSSISLIFVQADGTIDVGGTGLDARVNADGTPDTSFSPAAGTGSLLAVQPDGKLLVASGSGVARLNVDGSLDTSFTGAALTCTVAAAVVQSDGRIVVVGTQDSVGNGASIYIYVTRLNTDGSLDASFQSGLTSASSVVECAAVQSDDKILIGGTYYTNRSFTSGVIRLNADGSPDTSFEAGRPDTSHPAGKLFFEVLSVLEQPDGKILVGDDGGPDRLTSDGSFDSSFQVPEAYRLTANALALQPDGKIIFGGVIPDGGGGAGLSLARVNADGSADTIFDTSSYGGNVSSLALQPDGKLVVGGDAGLARFYAYTALDPTPPVKTDLNDDGYSDLVWQNTVTGEHAVWFLQNGVFQGGATVPAVDPIWHIAACADFDGDGYSDYVWENTENDYRVIWFCQNGQPLSQIALPEVTMDWRIAGAGDLDGDGQADLVWENTTTGRVDAWFLKAGVLQSVYTIGYVDPAWQVVGVGDMNGDGLADLVLQNPSDGERSVVFCQYGVATDTVFLETIDPVWNIAGVGDFDGDGYGDLVWENSSTGERFIEFMKDAVYQSALSLPAVSTEWVIANH